MIKVGFIKVVLLFIIQGTKQSAVVIFMPFISLEHLSLSLS
jgi:hypothetical protein